MKKLFTPTTVIMYLLTFLVFDIIGMTIAGITGAAENQGLAGGAIVFMYGIYAAIAALVTALIFCYKADTGKIKIANRILAVLLFILLAGVAVRIFLMNGSKDNASVIYEKNSDIVSINFSPAKLLNDDSESEMGLGFFKPDLLGKSTLYFYGEQNLDKSVYEQTPDDSLVFEKTDQSNYNLIYAPPWLLPEHNKLDYDIFYFKLISVGTDFVEVSVNDKIKKVSYLDRHSGEILFWPEFLLRVHSVELLPESDGKIRIKPLQNASEINMKYDFLKPVLVQNEWALVELYDEDYNRLSKGWIRWKKNNELQITYSLLS